MNRSMVSIQESIKESAAELENRFLKTKDNRVRERLQMLYWLKLGIVSTLLVLSQMLGRERRSLSRWLKTYENQGLEALLKIGTSPGRPSSLSTPAQTELAQKLSQPAGFSSYKEIQQWLDKQHQCRVTIHVLYRFLKKFRARPKVARPRHYKQDSQKTKEFETQFPQTVAKIEAEIQKDPPSQQRPIRLWFQDESRVGFFTIKRRRITMKGVKPIGPVQNEFENCYVYGGVEPKTGDYFFLELPYFESEGFQIFLDELALYDPHSFHIVFCDRAGVHQSKSLRIPANIRLEKLPAYSPELNPVERVWEEIKAHLAWKIFADLEELIDEICQVIKGLTKEIIHSLTAYPYILKAFPGT